MGIQQTIKANIRDLIASTLALCGLTRFSHLPSSSLTILTFHRVLPASLRVNYPLPGLVVTPDELHWVLSVVKNYFEIHTLSNAYRLSRKGDAKKPILAVTFDDGQWDNLEYGCPVLAALNTPATFYIPTAFVGGEALLWHDEAAFAWQQLAERRKKIFTEISANKLPDMVYESAGGFLQFLKTLTSTERNQFIAQLKKNNNGYPSWSRLMNWNEITYLHEQNHEIGSHARTHSLLSHLSLEGQRQELIESEVDIRNAIGVAPVSFCYPDGNYNEDTLSLLKDGLYETAVTTQWGINHDTSDNYKLQRCDVGSQHLRNSRGVLSKSRFQFRLSKYHPSI